MNLEKLFEMAHDTIQMADEVLIVSPSPPDVDSVACCCLLHQYCRQTSWHKKITLFCKTKLPQTSQNSLFQFLPTGHFTTQLPKPLPKCIIISDYGTLSMSGLDDIPTDTIVIGFDHHKRTGDFPKNSVEIVDTSAPANTELIYRFMLYVGKFPVNPSLRTVALTYVALGIYADTGRLTNDRTTTGALRLFSKCIEGGIPWEKIRAAAEPRMTFQKMHLWEEAFGDIRTNCDKETGLVWYYAGLLKINAWGGHKNLESLLGPMQMLEDTRVYVLILEQHDRKLKISIRSKDPKKIPANHLAEIFNGGGHPNMAAAIVPPDIRPHEILKKIKEEIKNLDK